MKAFEGHKLGVWMELLSRPPWLEQREAERSREVGRGLMMCGLVGGSCYFRGRH